MGGLHEITGRCHCGNISYTFISPVPKMELPIRTCGCSFCIKQGACYTSHPQSQLHALVAQREETARYRFGTELADVFLCTKCGVFPFIVGEIDGQTYAVLNANSINGLHIDRDKVKQMPHLENQTAEERVERWKKAWIPHVEIDYQPPGVNAAILV